MNKIIPAAPETYVLLADLYLPNPIIAWEVETGEKTHPIWFGERHHIDDVIGVYYGERGRLKFISDAYDKAEALGVEDQFDETKTFEFEDRS